MNEFSPMKGHLDLMKNSFSFSFEREGGNEF